MSFGGRSLVALLVIGLAGCASSSRDDDASARAYEAEVTRLRTQHEAEIALLQGELERAQDDVEEARRAGMLCDGT